MATWIKTRSTRKREPWRESCPAFTRPQDRQEPRRSVPDMIVCRLGIRAGDDMHETIFRVMGGISSEASRIGTVVSQVLLFEPVARF
jgi:hypothetical protein